MRIERIYHRKKPIINGAPPLRPIGWSNITTYVQLWDHLERGGVTDVTGVWDFIMACSRSSHCASDMRVTPTGAHYRGRIPPR